MIIKLFAVGVLSTNCYVASCEETLEAVIIDPGFDNKSAAEEIVSYVDQKGLKLKFILDTHGHPDHVCGNGIVKERFHVPIEIHENDAYLLGEPGRELSRLFGFDCHSPPADVFLRDGDSVRFGHETLKVMHTPGHTPGSIVLVGEKEVFTGDTLFSGSVGRTDLPGSSPRAMVLSLKKLLGLSNHCVVYPGHGSATTIEEEKLVNLFLQRL